MMMYALLFVALLGGIEACSRTTAVFQPTHGSVHGGAPLIYGKPFLGNAQGKIFTNGLKVMLGLRLTISGVALGNRVMAANVSLLIQPVEGQLQLYIQADMMTGVQDLIAAPGIYGGGSVQMPLRIEGNRMQMGPGELNLSEGSFLVGNYSGKAIFDFIPTGFGAEMTAAIVLK